MENQDMYTTHNAATTGNGNAYTMGRRPGELAVYVIWSAGVTAGAVAIDTADTTSYTGTWARLGTVTFGGTADKTDVFSYTGVLAAIRTPITTTVTGGTVTVKILAGS